MSNAKTLPSARTLHRAGGWSGADDSVTLDYAGRILRRKRLVSDSGLSFLVDLPQATALNHGDAFQLGDGRLVRVAAAKEALYAVYGDLARLAWHVGNRHTPCQIEADRLLIQRDHVLRDMLSGLGARVDEIEAPFTPEGGAYGHGRTHAHG